MLSMILKVAHKRPFQIAKISGVYNKNFWKRMK